MHTGLKVYFRFGPVSALVGPLWAYEVGDKVSVPPRGSKMGDNGVGGFHGVVTSIHSDGMAAVHLPEEPQGF
jgi:hypothetical protein